MFQYVSLKGKHLKITTLLPRQHKYKTVIIQYWVVHPVFTFTQLYDKCLFLCAPCFLKTGGKIPGLGTGWSSLSSSPSPLVLLTAKQDHLRGGGMYFHHNSHHTLWFLCNISISSSWPLTNSTNSFELQNAESNYIISWLLPGKLGKLLLTNSLTTQIQIIRGKGVDSLNCPVFRIMSFSCLGIFQKWPVSFDYVTVPL